MAEIHKTRTCERCKAAVPLPEVKLFPKNAETNLLVCAKCCEELVSIRKNSGRALNPKISNIPAPKASAVLNVPPKVSTPIKSAPAIATPRPRPAVTNTQSLRSPGSLPEPHYIKYMCLKCRYLFKVDQAKVGLMQNLRCPYCGKADYLETRP